MIFLYINLRNLLYTFIHLAYSIPHTCFSNDCLFIIIHADHSKYRSDIVNNSQHFGFHHTHKNLKGVRYLAKY